MPEITMIAMVAGVGVVDVVAIMALCLMKKGEERAALLPSAVVIALIAPLLAMAVACFSSMHGFSAAASSSFSVQGMALRIASSLEALIAGLMGLLVALLIAALLALPSSLSRRRTGRPERRPASARRQMSLLALSILAVALVAAPFEYVRESFSITTWVLTTPENEGSARVPPYMEGNKDDFSGVASISRVSERVASGMILGQLGAIAVAFMLVGIATASAVLAWPFRASRAASLLFLGWAFLLIVLWTLPLAPLSKEIKQLRRFVTQTDHEPDTQPILPSGTRR